MMGPGRRTSPIRVPAVAALAVAVAACATVPQARVVEPEGRLPVLGPSPAFSLEILPRDWIVEGAAGGAGSRLSIVRVQGIPALRVVNGRAGFVVARRTNAFLLATPFLSWSWNMAPHGAGLHPVRLLIGFHGGNPTSRSWGAQPFVWLGSALPPYDRLLTVAWGDSALQRGDLAAAVAEGKAPRSEVQARYVARGGREQAGLWWLETVDLAKTYAVLWPRDDRRRVKVVFIGVSATGGRAPAAAHYSGIVLSR